MFWSIPCSTEASNILSIDLMHILRNSSVAQELNAYTSEDYTTYVFRTEAEQDFYNLADIYTTCVLFPLLRSEPNIFKQQGIRIEYSDGKARYNGIVYSELRLKSLGEYGREFARFCIR